MGACSSCIRLLLDAEADVKIHVIEPTSVNGAVEPAAAPPPPREPLPPSSTLQVPNMLRVRTPEPTDPRIEFAGNTPS